MIPKVTIKYIKNISNYSGIQKSGDRRQETGVRSQNSRFKIQDSRFKIQDSEDRIQNVMIMLSAGYVPESLKVLADRWDS
jgi:hypothetical protein